MKPVLPIGTPVQLTPSGIDRMRCCAWMTFAPESIGSVLYYMGKNAGRWSHCADHVYPSGVGIYWLNFGPPGHETSYTFCDDEFEPVD